MTSKQSITEVYQSEAELSLSALLTQLELLGIGKDDFITIISKYEKLVLTMQSLDSVVLCEGVKVKKLNVFINPIILI